MDYTKSLTKIHKEIQKKIFIMIPEKWDRLYLYACIIDHFSKVQTGEMFFFYYPKGVLRKRPVNVYEVPIKFNVDEKQYLKLADDLYDSIKKLRQETIADNERPWSNITISIEKSKYKVEYGYEDLNSSEDDINERHVIWSYKYLNMSYDSFNKKERKIIDKYLQSVKEPTNVYEVPLYIKKIGKELRKTNSIEKRMTFVKEEKMKELEYTDMHIPKSQILK